MQRLFTAFVVLLIAAGADGAKPGLATDPKNVDLLIAGYRLPEPDPVYHNKIRGLIKEAAIELSKRALVGSDQLSRCNELAWLIANTEGDFDEAIRLECAR